MQDLYSLDRFIKAQEENFEQALAEIKNGRKETHWIWYVFPQLRGLGHSQRISQGRYFTRKSDKNLPGTL